ncbi:N-acetylmuramic acid 6-phosphate etherase [Pirellulimonas nuda]|uniref:N-acetylmuramic acid 6-phosphate etherase n=1 Tax=Pirellulimonas nuda TaxID=2528009 RepID=A0A518DAI8_9BACT|nr:N-acetylmuramic acid 6-phosphate etherase [Pirellulimonas nuda]QDU88501.1 N-acetylmuramic acid 6-phosphate etherase [Pirellulimonas nuda]
MLQSLTTESRNPASTDLDSLSPLAIVRLINAEDARIAASIAEEELAIARAVEVVSERLEAGGRLFYFGAGTSGRLGVLDAAECPPTFNSDPNQVIGIIAGGPSALLKAVEGAEDSQALAIEDLKGHNVSVDDAVVGIATSGRTPYVIGGLSYARSRGAFTIALTCNRDAEVAMQADLVIAPIVGPEVLSGSTRMKAGTATKMVLNMISTGVMVQLGKTFGNLMVDVQQTNSKLAERARWIVSEATGLEADQAIKQLETCEGEVKTAIVAWQADLAPERARELLAAYGGHIGRALAAAAASESSNGKSH